MERPGSSRRRDRALAAPAPTDTSEVKDSTADLASLSHDLMGGATRFALRHTERLSQYGTHWPTDDSLPLTLVDKVLVETALLGLVFSRASTNSAISGADGRELAEAIYSGLDTERLVETISRQPQAAASIGIVVAFLDQQQVACPRLGDLVRRAFSSQLVLGTERLPYRQMELSWVSDSLAGGFPQPIRPSDVSGSILRQPPDPMYVSAVDLYALTHAVMFVTDFGASKPRGWANRRTECFIDSTCVWQLANDNLDIAGELVMAGAYLGFPMSAHRFLAWQLMVDTWGD